MELYEKIKFMRKFKDWSQELMAEKLDMAVSGYAKIEQGKTDINYSRMQQIAGIFGIEVVDLIGLNNKNVLNIIGNYDNEYFINIYPQDTVLKHENEKLHIINEQQIKEIAYLKEMIEMLKK